ncbi:MAG: T9SS type A sorting domain-containing protein [Saprospiraceae bacterium]
MKFLNITILVLVVYSSSFSQNIISYDLFNQGNNTLKVGSTFDINGPGPLVQDNSTISLFVPMTLTSPVIINLQGGSWTATIVPNMTLLLFCAEAANYDLIQISAGGQANLGSVTAGISEDLFTVSFSGTSSLPIYAYDPTLVDPLSACLDGFGLGVDNVASIDPDGNAGPLPTISYSEIPGSSAVFLPIELTSFTARPLNGTDALLNWTTATELNSAHFEVERSSIGENWTAIGEVNAAGTSQTDQYYSLVDRNAFDPAKLMSATFYYRLKMVNYDGSFEYSELRLVKFEGYGGFFVGVPFPNPARLSSNSVQLPVSVLTETEGRFDIYDYQGSLVISNISFISKGDNNLSIGTSNLSTGVYHIKLTIENGGTFVREMVLQ